MKKGKDIPNWVWFVIGFLAIATIILFVKYQKTTNYYYDCVLEKIDDTKEYLDLTQDYLELLICYQDGLPTCEPQILKYGNASVFTQKSS